MKKLVSLLLALAMMFTCTLAMAELDVSKVVNNPDEKFTIAWLGGHDTTPMEEDSLVIAWLEETFNVELECWFVDRSSYDELLTTRIIGGDIPDIFLMEDNNQFSKFVKQGVCLELPIEVIQQCMPNSYAWLMEYDPTCFYNVTYDGKNYGLPRVNGDGQYNYAPMWRADWLDKFGYEGTVPMTLAEVEEVFYKMANEDPDGNGVKDTYALSNTGMLPIYGAFGALPDRWVDDGEGNLIYGAVHPGMKDALTLLAKWYKDGLIDPEFVTGENQGGHWSLSIPFENGVIGFSSPGAFYQATPDFDGPTNEETGEGSNFNYGKTVRTLGNNPEFGYEKVRIGYNPVGPDGKSQGGDSWGFTTSEALVFSYKLAEEPAKLARILEIVEAIGSDYDTWWKIFKWDLEPEQYTYDDLLGYVPNDPNYDRAAKYGENHGNLFNSLQNPNFRKVYDPAQYNWADSMPMYKTGGYSRVMLPITTASQPKYWTSMETLRETTFMRIITGEASIEEYDSFVEQWYKMGGEQITKEANEWYHSL